MSDNEKTLALLAALVGVRASGPRKPRRPRMADEIARLRDENGALRAAVERVRALHAPIAEDIPKCVVCKNYDGYHVDHPCPTLRVLEKTP